MSASGKQGASGGKVCVICRKDVSQSKRTKDASGRYYCDPCYRSLLASTHTTASPYAEKPVGVPEPAPVTTGRLEHPGAKAVSPKPLWRAKLLSLVGVLVLLVGAAAGVLMMLSDPKSDGVSVAAPQDENDVYSRPERLKESGLNADRISVFGVKVGDNQASVLAARPGLEVNQYGSIPIDVGVVAVFDDKKVQTIIVSNGDWIKRAGLKNYHDASKVLGTADAEQYSSTDELAILISRREGKPSPPPRSGLTDYFYLKRGIEIRTVDGETGSVHFTQRPGTTRLKSFVESIEGFAAVLEKQQSDISVGMTIMDLRSNLQQMAAARKKFGSPPLAWKIASDFEHNADEAIESYTRALRSWSNGGTARDDAMSAAAIFARQALSKLGQMRSKLG